MISGSVLIIAFLIYLPLEYGSASRLNVQKDELTIATVKRGTFQEYIPVDGTVTPINTVDLDAIEGGVIRKIKQTSGAIVKPGDTLLILSNSRLQLSVMNQESGLYDQINNARDSRIRIQQNSLNIQTQLVQAEHNLSVDEPEFKRDSMLFARHMISQKAYETSKAAYQLDLKQQHLAYSYFVQDSLLRNHQIRQLNESEERMERNLTAVQHILDNLVVTAPIGGQLTTPNLEIGQSINSGERLGQIDVLHSYKVSADIDEHYITRIQTGLTATVDYNGKLYRLKVTKVYPTVTNGQFEVDLKFANGMPDDLIRGQALQLRLQLGHSEQALLLPRGGFYQSTGGNWVYLVNKDGTQAIKHNIQLGRQNPDYFEVLKGLKPGDEVVVSSYDNFGNNEILQF